MLEMSRRRVLFGLSSAGLLTALPLPVALIAEEFVAEAVAVTPAPLYGSVVLMLSGTVESSGFKPEGAAVLDPSSITMEIEKPIINTSIFGSSYLDYNCGLPDPNLIKFEGFISHDLQDALITGREIYATFKLPGLDQWLTVQSYVKTINLEFERA